jgi:hypothetical protein
LYPARLRSTQCCAVSSRQRPSLLQPLARIRYIQVANVPNQEPYHGTSRATPPQKARLPTVVPPHNHETERAPNRPSAQPEFLCTAVPTTTTHGSAADRIHRQRYRLSPMRSRRHLVRMVNP